MSKNKLYLNAKLNIEEGDKCVQILSDDIRKDLFEKISSIKSTNGTYEYGSDICTILMELSTKLNISVAEIAIDNDTITFTAFDGNKYEYVTYCPRRKKLKKIMDKITK